MNLTKDQLLAVINTIDFATDNDASYEEYTIDRQYPMQYDIPSLDEVEYSYLDSLLTAGTSK